MGVTCQRDHFGLFVYLQWGQFTPGGAWGGTGRGEEGHAARGREGGKRNVNNGKIENEMTRRQTVWLTNVN